jgi:branched-chain amino acid transport system substrate-binding protein
VDIRTGLAAALACLVLLQPAGAQDGNGPVKVGVLGDQSSAYADAGGKGSVEAARMAAEDAGAVLGKPVQVVAADFQLKPDVGMSIARRWYDVEGVDAIIDMPLSALALAIADLTREKRKIALYSAAASSDLTGPRCSPYTAQWTYDNYSLARGPTTALIEKGDKSWFFLTTDNAFGANLQKEAEAAIAAGGGNTLGSARIPLNSADQSSFLLQAQSSKAAVIGLANAGADLANSVKQGEEFGLRARGQKFAALLATIDAIDGIGLKAAQGLIVSEAFYWDQDDKTRAFAKRFHDRMKRMPTQVQAAAYSATSHYLKAIKAAGTKDPDAVMAKMRELPINDFMTTNGRLRPDGRVLRDLYLFEVKAPAESSGRWDYYKLLSVIPADKATRPLDQGGCPLVKR